MAATPEEILQKLKQKQYAPVYFLQGEETYYIDAIADYIEENVLNDAEKGFNQVVMYGKDTDVAQVLMQAKRFPMMAEYQVVIVKEAQSLPDLEKEGGIKQMEGYLKNPQPSTILVFCYKHKTLDGRKALAKVVSKHAVVLTTKKLYDNQVPTWINNYVKTKGFQINPQATILLSEFIGSDLSRLVNEIDKLVISLKPGESISEKSVQENIGISKDYNIFELQSALVKQDVLKVNRIINYFEANPKNNPLIPNLTMLFNYFTQLLCMHMQPDKSESGIGKALGNRRFLAKEYMLALRVFHYGRTKDIIQFIRQADLQVKGIEGGNMNEAAILRELCFKILHPVPKVVAA